MKLPFVRRKYYDNLYNNYCVVSDARRDVAESFENFQKEILELLPKNNEVVPITAKLKLCLDDFNAKIIEQRKEIKKLKTLLTRNGISYKKVVKK